jgi:hypothetical protein
MLINTLENTITILDKLLSITLEDIENIKLAKHEEVFKNTKTKENLAYKFSELKSQIDNILISRNKPLEEIFTPEEEKLFNLFREKLIEFNKQHKRFARLAFSVANFYNTLLNKIQNNEKVDYSSTYKNSNLKLKA